MPGFQEDFAQRAPLMLRTESWRWEVNGNGPMGNSCGSNASASQSWQKELEPRARAGSLHRGSRAARSCAPASGGPVSHAAGSADLRCHCCAPAAEDRIAREPLGTDSSAWGTSLPWGGGKWREGTRRASLHGRLGIETTKRSYSGGRPGSESSQGKEGSQQQRLCQRQGNGPTA